MFIRIATLFAAALATAVLGASPGYADPAQDQQYLSIVRPNGVSGGQDPALIAFAQQFCSPNPPPFLDTVGALYGQGVWPSQVYILKVAASRVYCPDRIATPIQPW
jgi:hypothetical protein